MKQLVGSKNQKVENTKLTQKKLIYEYYPRNRNFLHPHHIFFFLFYLPPRTFVSNEFTSCLPSASSQKHFCIYLRSESPFFLVSIEWAILEFRCNNFRETAYQSLSAERGRLENRNRWTWSPRRGHLESDSRLRFFSQKLLTKKLNY